jgi:vacuolar protein sorting-associated protein 13B
MVTGVGSWEGVGSPTRLVGEVSTGLRDFVVYPYQGIFKGPTGFFFGIGKGCSSMVKHIAAGTLSSVTNGAWTWSRNLDALTQDDEDRRADVHGVTDGITQGFASLGVRMLGAVGGIAHYPIQSIIQGGTSPKNIAAGVAKGVVSVVTKPVGGALELLAMTGEGILKGTGWSNDNQTRFKPICEDIQNANSSTLKYFNRIIREEYEQRVLLVIDAAQPEPTNTSLIPSTLVIATENLYVFNTASDEMTLQFPVCKLIVAPCEDRNLLCLRIVNHKKPDDYSVAEERVMEFVRGFASAHSLAATEETSTSTNHFTTQIPIKSSKADVTTTSDDFGNFFVDYNSKLEFINVLNWAKKILNGDFYKSN